MAQWVGPLGRLKVVQRAEMHHLSGRSVFSRALRTMSGKKIDNRVRKLTTPPVLSVWTLSPVNNSGISVAGPAPSPKRG